MKAVLLLSTLIFLNQAYAGSIRQQIEAQNNHELKSLSLAKNGVYLGLGHSAHDVDVINVPDEQREDYRCQRGVGLEAKSAAESALANARAKCVIMSAHPEMCSNLAVVGNLLFKFVKDGSTPNNLWGPCVAEGQFSIR